MTAGRLLGERFGLRVDGSTRSRLERLLALGAERAGRDRAGYAELLEGDAAELQWLVERLTVQETEFFRHPAQFDVVAQRVSLLMAGQGGDDGPGTQGGVIWSAGCANGQEAWSLAMLLEELGAPGWSVVGSDLSAEAVARAVGGVYTGRELRGLADTRRRRFMRQVADDAYEVAPALRERVRFTRHNLAVDPPPLEVDGRIVLCRNVLIYLRRRVVDRFLERLRRRMPQGGLLLLGAAESLPADHQSFVARRFEGGYLYVPRGKEPADAAATWAARAAALPRRRASRRARRGEGLPDVAELVAAGEAHAAGGRFSDAAAAFRKASYLRPWDGMVQTRLAFALEAAGDDRGARRAFRAARVALSEAHEAELGGWSVKELRRVVSERARPAG